MKRVRERERDAKRQRDFKEMLYLNNKLNDYVKHLKQQFEHEKDEGSKRHKIEKIFPKNESVVRHLILPAEKTIYLNTDFLARSFNELDFSVTDLDLFSLNSELKNIFWQSLGFFKSCYSKNRKLENGSNNYQLPKIHRKLAFENNEELGFKETTVYFSFEQKTKNVKNIIEVLREIDSCRQGAYNCKSIASLPVEYIQVNNNLNLIYLDQPAKKREELWTFEVYEKHKLNEFDASTLHDTHLVGFSTSSENNFMTGEEEGQDSYFMYRTMECNEDNSGIRVKVVFKMRQKLSEEKRSIDGLYNKDIMQVFKADENSMPLLYLAVFSLADTMRVKLDSM